MSIQAQSECLPDILLSLIWPLKWHKDVDETCKSRMFQEVDWNRFYSINAYHFCWGHESLPCFVCYTLLMGTSMPARWYSPHQHLIFLDFAYVFQTFQTGGGICPLTVFEFWILDPELAVYRTVFPLETHTWGNLQVLHDHDPSQSTLLVTWLTWFVTCL